MIGLTGVQAIGSRQGFTLRNKQENLCGLPAPPSQGGWFRALLLSLAWAHRGPKAATRHFQGVGFGGASRDWDWND